MYLEFLKFILRLVNSSACMCLLTFLVLEEFYKNNFYSFGKISKCLRA